MSSSRVKSKVRFHRSDENRRDTLGNNAIGANVRSGKVAPHANLVMLKLDGSNITSWEDALRHHLEVSYGPVGCFLQHNALLVRPIMTAAQIGNMYPGHNAAGLAQLHQNATMNHMKCAG